MSSVRELEARNAYERKQLMQALYDYLNQTGVKVELQHEEAMNIFWEAVQEPVIHLKEQNINRIRLAGSIGGGCDVPGNILHFQYEVRLDKELSPQQMKDMSAGTRIIKEGKVLNMVGGKVTGVKWTGKRLAGELNKDQSISADLLKCVKSWSHLEFQIEAVSPGEVHISGPRFTNPGRIAQLYQADAKEEIQCCVFGYATLDKIAGHIRNGVI